MNALDDVLMQMSLEEKVSFCSGKDFWTLQGLERLGLPSIMVTDGPHGVRKQSASTDHLGINESIPATCFPTASLLASTWNPELLFKMGEALALECHKLNVGVLLGPGVNLKRSPLCGRNFEYFSEDPFITSKLASALVKGIQSKGIGTSLKHFAANNQEFRRMITDVIVDERTLRELYLMCFEEVVKSAQPMTLMSAYNRLNGTYCSENQWLLTRVLREEWGFNGVVLTDWGATNDRVKGLIAGEDIEMPGITKENNQKVYEAILNNHLDISILDQSIKRQLEVSEKIQRALNERNDFDPLAHHELAKEIASEGIVLLKNEEQVLPVEIGEKIAILGLMAKEPKYQGSGSSFMNPTKLDNFYDAMVSCYEHEGYSANWIDYAPAYNGHLDMIDINHVLEIARRVHKVILCIGLPEVYESEGFDRERLELPEVFNTLVVRIQKVNPSIIVVLSNGSPVHMPWVSKVPGIIEGYLYGQAGASALAEIVCGLKSPSGCLAETFPLDLEASKYFPGGDTQVVYKEGLYVGYRFYDSFNREVLFPFGHGLTYSSFQIEPLRISNLDAWSYDVAFRVKNLGNYRSKVILQLYVSPKEMRMYHPKQALKAFKKVDLGPNEALDVVLNLDKRAFAYYDVVSKDWEVESGSYEIRVGFSSRNIIQTTLLEIEGTQVPSLTETQLEVQNYYKNITKDHLEIEDTIFEKLLGRSIVHEKNKAFDLNTPIYEMRHTVIGKILYYIVSKETRKMSSKQKNAGMKKMIESVLSEITLRNMAMMSSGAVTFKMAEGFLEMANGHYIKGIKTIIKRTQ